MIFDIFSLVNIYYNIILDEINLIHIKGVENSFKGPIIAAKTRTELVEKNSTRT